MRAQSSERHMVIRNSIQRDGGMKISQKLRYIRLIPDSAAWGRVSLCAHCCTCRARIEGCVHGIFSEALMGERGRTRRIFIYEGLEGVETGANANHLKGDLSQSRLCDVTRRGWSPFASCRRLFTSRQQKERVTPCAASRCCDCYCCC